MRPIKYLDRSIGGARAIPLGIMSATPISGWSSAARP